MSNLWQPWTVDRVGKSARFFAELAEGGYPTQPRGGRRDGQDYMANRHGPREGLSHIAEALRPLAVPTDTLHLTPRRPRHHGQRNLDAIRASLMRFGQQKPIVVDADGVYRKTGPARVFTRERDAVAAIKGQTDRPIKPGDVM
ncbi:hypothetical protein LCGC14_2268320, partial [marine sediment metagenome]